MWASAVKPPTLAGALTQFPRAQIIRPTSQNDVYYVDGSVEDWWVWSTDRYELMPVMHLKLVTGEDLLIERCAVDSELTGIIYGRARGRYAFVATREVVVLIGFHSSYRHENLTAEMRKVHKPSFSFSFKWPREEEVEAQLQAHGQG